MNIPEKESQLIMPIDGMNSDISAEELSNTQTRKQINCRSYTFGAKGKITNLKGNTQIPYTQPAGTNITLGAEADEATNRIFFLNYNSNGYHTWYILDIILNKVSVLLQSISDSDGVDILRLDPRSRGKIQIDIEDHNLLYWTEWGYNKARKLNITKCLDKTATGYGSIILEDYITAYKKAPVYAPVPTYLTDLTRNSNQLFGLLVKFMYLWVYDDRERSNYSDYSLVPKPINQSYTGVSAINTDNNAIMVPVNTGSRIVVKIEIAVQIGSLHPVTCAVIHKDELLLSDNSIYNFVFYNDGANTATIPAKIIRPYSSLPDRPKCQSKVKEAITYTNFTEGWPKVIVNAKVDVSYVPLFVPDVEDDVLNAPSITITETSHFSKSAGFLSGHYIVNLTHFTIGPDVKTGNRFVVTGNNGGSDNFFFSYTAGPADNTITVAQQIKSFLRSLGRGVPDAHNGISGEGTSGGDQYWDFEYLGRYNENKTTFGGSVNPVNFAQLKDNGYSQQLAKDGCVRQYAFMYQDDDGRWSLGYTSDACSRRLPFLTETGVELQKSIDTITISHQPPLRARYWQLVRTLDEVNFIHILIQQVITVNATPTDDGTYLDLVVGSLFTYQKIHPSTILQYTFEKGDRLRLIKNENTLALYPYYETEVLSYSIDTEVIVNDQITVHGTDHVTPTIPPDADHVGKFIVIAGYEREIISVSGSDYVLAFPISVGNVATPTTSIEPTYTFVDRRGIIRIKKPDVISIVNFSTLELYKPQKNSDDGDYKIFQLCGQKYEVSNYGTDQRAHVANQQNQDGTSPSTLISTPAIVSYDGGDVYLRFRAMPSNNQLVNAQVIIDHIVDPNFSDFYESNLNDLGLQVPQDTGAGEVYFPDRVRFSNNYIQDTQINGLNDFDNLDREDYNDSNGAIQRTEYLNDRLYFFKELITCYTMVFKSIIVDNSGNQLIGTSSKLLNQLQYLTLRAGVGNNPESVIINGNYIYYASVNFGAFIRIAGDGSDPISTIYNYDKDARTMLAVAGQYNLPLIPGVDRQSGEVMWSIPSYQPLLFNKIFDTPDWQTSGIPLPGGITWIITQQPANSTASIVGGLFNITGTTTLGDDFLLYKVQYADLSFGPIKKFCFTVIAAPPQPPAYRLRSSSVYCLPGGGAPFTGKQGWTLLEGYNIATTALSGLITFNLPKISPQAFVPDGSGMTYNFVNVAPSGGSNNDLWYNTPADTLYKKIAGVWTLLTDRVTNIFYATPIDNTGSCPIPPPANHFNIRSQYGMTVIGVVDVLTTGTPPLASPISVGPGGLLSLAYTAINIGAGGTSKISLTGMPASPFVEVHLVVNGILVDSKPVTGPGDYTLTYPAGVTSPTDISWEIDLH